MQNQKKFIGIMSKKLEYYPSLVPDVDDLFNLSTNLALGKKQQLKFERQD